MRAVTENPTYNHGGGRRSRAIKARQGSEKMTALKWTSFHGTKRRRLNYTGMSG